MLRMDFRLRVGMPGIRARTRTVMGLLFMLKYTGNMVMRRVFRMASTLHNYIFG